MAEILIRVVDKRNLADPQLDRACFRRGDVIAICPDGCLWGNEELLNPDLRILRVPGTVADFEDLRVPPL
jgi:hypothetical protein